MIFEKNAVLVNLQYVVIILLIIKAEKLHDLNSVWTVENSYENSELLIYSYLKKAEFMKIFMIIHDF